VQLVTRHGRLDLSGTPAVMGILNVTPDSFSDGGQFLDRARAVEQATRMVREGAAIIDVGPESSRPGAQPVPPQQQIERAVPVIAEIRARHPDLAISIDTASAEVAEAAWRAGADILNDITALRGDPAMAALAAERGIPVVLMHMRGTPATMQIEPRYDDVVGEVQEFLIERMTFACGAGIRPEQLVLDPGIGFGKTTAHNGVLLRRLDELAALGRPVLVGVSRKSFVRAFVGTTADTVRAGSLMAALAAAAAGAKILRVHDVGATVTLLRAATPALPRVR
jgi:dihydropteroate synthase